MGNTITLRGETYELGDLTAAVLEDMPDACQAFFRMPPLEADAEVSVVSGESLRAGLTLGAEAVRRGGRPEMTREAFRELVQLPDLAALYAAIGRALGLRREVGKGAAAGEATRPEGSPPPATSSGA